MVGVLETLVVKVLDAKLLFEAPGPVGIDPEPQICKISGSCTKPLPLAAGLGFRNPHGNVLRRACIGAIRGLHSLTLY